MKEPNLKIEISQSDSIHTFHHLDPDSREPQLVLPIENKAKIYKKDEKKIKKPSQPTVFGTTFLLSNMCLGTTIFTFAIRAKSFGLIGFLICCFLVGVLNYWSLSRCCIASSRVKEDDYSSITQRILGKKARTIINILIIIYTYAYMMCFLALIYSLFGRFILSIKFREKYDNFQDFRENIWGKPYIKFPFYIGLAFILSLICLNKDIKKLKYTAFIGVSAVTYTLLVVAFQCHSYYEYYKKTVYVKEDKKTHPNWFNIGSAFTKDLDFFKGMACLFGAYACHTGIFPVFSGFKRQENGLIKMKYSIFFSTTLNTFLHFLAIVCSFLTEPVNPEDLIIYRKDKGNGKDILMTISKLLMTFSLIATTPTNYIGLRLSIANSFTKGIISKKFNYILTFSSIYGCALVAAMYDKVLNYLSYIGGFFTVFVSYLFPILLYIYSNGKPLTYWKNLLELFIAILLCCIGIIAGIATIIDDIKG